MSTPTSGNRRGGSSSRGRGRGGRYSSVYAQNQRFFAAPSPGYWDFANDSLYGVRKQYTSFENPKPTRVAKANGAKPKSYEQSKTPPDDLDCRSVVIDPQSMVCFSGRNHWLSSFYTAAMRIDGHTYPSVEHYYQACKLFMLGGAQFSNQIRRIGDAGAVKVTARQLLRGAVSDDEVNRWKVLEGPRLLEVDVHSTNTWLQPRVYKRGRVGNCERAA